MTPQPLSRPLQSRVPWWLWLNVLSLDAPLVAVLWQAALAHSYRVTLLPGAQITLFLAVWLIYMMDRTLDSFAPVAAERMSARHAFYRRNRRLFVLVAIPAAASLLGLLSMLSIPATVMLRGALLAFFVAIYLLHFAARNHRGIYLAGNLLVAALGVLMLWWLPLPPRFQLLATLALLGLLALMLSPRWRMGARLLPKEMICGYLFAVGCSLSVSFHTMDVHAGPFSAEVLLMAVLFALNCVAIACYERKTDAAFDPSSIAQTLPGIVRMYPGLLATFGIFAALLVTGGMQRDVFLVGVAVMLSTALLAALHLFARRLKPELSRVLADVAVALPILLLIVRA